MDLLRPLRLALLLLCPAGGALAQGGAADLPDPLPGYRLAMGSILDLKDVGRLQLQGQVNLRAHCRSLYFLPQTSPRNLHFTPACAYDDARPEEVSTIQLDQDAQGKFCTMRLQDSLDKSQDSYIKAGWFFNVGNVELVPEDPQTKSRPQVRLEIKGDATVADIVCRLPRAADNGVPVQGYAVSDLYHAFGEVQGPTRPRSFLRAFVPLPKDASANPPTKLPDPDKIKLPGSLP